MAEGEYSIRLSPAAYHDIRDILLWSLDAFGRDAATRYSALIKQAVRDVRVDPMRSGSRARVELAQNVRTYHMAFSRKHVAGERVKTPRHVLLYRVCAINIEILRIPHDGRDLVLHLPLDD